MIIEFLLLIVIKLNKYMRKNIDKLQNEADVNLKH